MREYIEREAALIICEKEYQERVKMQDWCGDTVAWNIGHAIKAIQTADAAPVVHSKWEITDVDHAHGGKCYHCPECGEDEWRYDAPNYCPNCGARMDGE